MLMCCKRNRSVRTCVLLLCMSIIVDGALKGCPIQCSCTLERSYHSVTGPFDQIDILCNRYAGQYGADLSTVPNITNLQSENRNIKLSIEQMQFTRLTGEAFGDQRLISLRLLHNPSLKSVDKEIFFKNANSLKKLTVLDHDNLENFPLMAVSNCRKLTNLSLQLKRPLVTRNRLSLKNLPFLKSLSLYGKEFLTVLPEISMLTELRQLSLSGMNLTAKTFPENFFSSLPNLVSLNLASNNLDRLPIEISSADKLKVLSLENNAFNFDGNRPYFDAVTKNLEVLNLRSNRFRSIPCETFQLPNLRYLKLSSKIICFVCVEDRDLVSRLNRTCNTGQTWFFRDPPSAITTTLKTIVPTVPTTTTTTESTTVTKATATTITESVTESSEHVIHVNPAPTTAPIKPKAIAIPRKIYTANNEPEYFATQYHEYMGLFSYDGESEGSGEGSDKNAEYFQLEETPPRHTDTVIPLSTNYGTEIWDTEPEFFKPSRAGVRRKSPTETESETIDLWNRSPEHTTHRRKRPPSVFHQRDEIRRRIGGERISETELGAEYYYYEYMDDSKSAFLQDEDGSGEMEDSLKIVP